MQTNGVIHREKLTGVGSDGKIEPISSLHNRLFDRMPLRSIKFTRMPINIIF